VVQPNSISFHHKHSPGGPLWDRVAAFLTPVEVNLVASDRGIFSFGNAMFFRSTGSIHLNKPVVDLRTTPDGNG
jgi:hypothetical protein